MIEMKEGIKPKTWNIDLKNFTVPDGCPFRWEQLHLNLVTNQAYADSKYIGQFEEYEDGIIIKMKNKDQ